MQYFSDPTKADKAAKVKAQIDEVKGIMIENLESLLERGERIETLQEKTHEMDQESYKFQRGATKLKRHMWYKNFKMWLLLIGVVLVRFFGLGFFFLMVLGVDICDRVDYLWCGFWKVLGRRE